MQDKQKSATSTTGKAAGGFTAEERAAMRERAREVKAAGRRGPRAGKAARYATLGFSDKANLD